MPAFSLQRTAAYSLPDIWKIQTVLRNEPQTLWPCLFGYLPFINGQDQDVTGCISQTNDLLLYKTENIYAVLHRRKNVGAAKRKVCVKK